MYCIGEPLHGQCSKVPATEVTHLELNQSGVFFSSGGPTTLEKLGFSNHLGNFFSLKPKLSIQILSCRFGENLEQKPGFEASIFHP